MTGLADVILGNPDDTARVPQLRQGVVTSASPLLVRVGAGASAVPATALGSYAPVAGDVVSVLVISGDRLVLGTSRASPTIPANIPEGLINRVAPVGSVTVSYGQSLSAITYQLNVHMRTDRLYRLSHEVRAAEANAGTGIRFRFRDSGTTDPGWMDSYRVIGASTSAAQFDGWIISAIVGTNVEKDYAIDLCVDVAAPGATVTFYDHSASCLCVEDVGPWPRQ